MKLYLNSLIVAVVSFFWSYIYYSGGLYPEDYTRPFVYRQLVPLLAKGIEFVGVPAGVALVVVMTVSGVGFYLALRKLAFQFYNLSSKQELYLVAGVLASMVMLGEYRKPYDLMTAWLVTLSVYYIYRVYIWKYLLVFTLANINRETTFLLILLSGVFWFPLVSVARNLITSKWLRLVAVQIVIFVFVTFIIRYVLREAPGSSLWVQPVENILKFADQPYRFILHLYGLLGLMWWMSRGWDSKPEYLRYAFGLFAPVLLVAYIVVCSAFEIRTFWEIAPIVILLSLPKP